MIDQDEAAAIRRTDRFLGKDLPAALRSVEYDLPSFGEPAGSAPLADVARAGVETRHVPGASDGFYLVEAFGDELLMQVQLNVWRFVVVYRIPAVNGVDVVSFPPRLSRWQAGAEQVGWTMGWREAASALNHGQVYVEAFAYAFTPQTLLQDERLLLFWRTDIVQMTRSLMLEARRCGVMLSPRAAGFEV